MTEPYCPPLGVCRGTTPEQQQAMQAASDKRYAELGVTQEIVDTVLPSGGKGFQWRFYQHGVEIPNGIQGLANAL
jgi:hypothetical protein